MNNLDVDHQRETQIPCGLAFDHSPDQRLSSVDCCNRAFSVPAGGVALPVGFHANGVGRDILVFSGASRLTRFVHTTHFSTKGDISR